jgi:hypothetical protein
MRRFKPGDKIVFAHPELRKNPKLNLPSKGEVVTVKALCLYYHDSYDIEGYEKTITNTPQSLNDKFFEPLISESKREKVVHKLSSPCPPGLLQLKQYDTIEQIPQTI